MHSEEEAPFALISVPSLPPNYVENYVESFHMQMALIHNVYIRGLNSIWLNAPLVKPGDVMNFTGYALSCTSAIHHHHRIEETVVFPALQSKLDMAHNLEQHEAFMSALSAFDNYMASVRKKADKYNSSRVRQLLKGFGEKLVEHLHDEVGDSLFTIGAGLRSILTFRYRRLDQRRWEWWRSPLLRKC